MAEFVILAVLVIILALTFIPSFRESSRRKAEGDTDEVLCSEWRDWNEGDDGAPYDQEKDADSVSGWYPLCATTPAGSAHAYYETEADRDKRRAKAAEEAAAKVVLTPGQAAHLRSLRNG